MADWGARTVAWSSMAVAFYFHGTRGWVFPACVAALSAAMEFAGHYQSWRDQRRRGEELAEALQRSVTAETINREAYGALGELLEAAADADAKLLSWVTDRVALVQIETGAQVSIAFAASPTIDGPDYWTAAVLGMEPSTPRSVARWLVEVNQLQTPAQIALDEAEATAERLANKPW
jgi:hypothetical protein